MHKAAKDKHFIKQPVYEGGPAAMKQFIGQHLRYPAEALENKIEGTVFVKYSINHKGEVVEAKVVTGLGHGCDEEALRLVGMLKFKGGKTRGLRVLYHKHIQIHFHLPAAKAQPVQVAYNYVETPAQKKPGASPKPAKKENGGYTIQLNF